MKVFKYFLIYVLVSVNPFHVNAQSVNETINYLNGLLKTNSYNLPKNINGQNSSVSQIAVDSNGKIEFQEYYMDRKNMKPYKGMVGYAYLKSLVLVSKTDVDHRPI